MTAIIRESCGSLAGALEHAASREPLCGFCACAEHAARLSAEALGQPPRIAAASTSPGSYLPPVTKEQAALNRGILLAELDEWERGHAPIDRHRRLKRVA